MLPNANESKESIVVMLDWFSGHLTDEVAELVRGKGHVLLFHGGGCTPFTQINDTHLHATLARLLINFENLWALQERKRLVDELGVNRTPKMKREDILSLVNLAWRSISHDKVAEKGYKQTGPTMPLTGPVAPEDVFPDLLKVMEQLHPSLSPTEVNMKLRDDQVAFVKAEFEAGRITTWADAHMLIEDQDGAGEALAEGLEAFGVDAKDTDDEPDESESDDDDADGGSGGLSAKGAVAGGGSADGGDTNCDHGNEGGDEGGDMPGGGAGGVIYIDDDQGDATVVIVDEKQRLSQEVAKAHRVLYEDAVRSRNDNMVRLMRKLMREENQMQKDASTDIGQLLKKKFEEESAEVNKRRKALRDEERKAEKDLEQQKIIRLQQEKAAEEARCANLQQMIVNRRDAEARRRAEQLNKAEQRWLQTIYPSLLARSCFKYMGRANAKKDGDKKWWFDRISEYITEKGCTRTLYLPEIWVDDPKLTQNYAKMQPFNGGPLRYVKCSMAMRDVLEGVCPAPSLGDPDPVTALRSLFRKCFPHAERIFINGTQYGCSRLLHQNDYFFDKAFVYGIICLSKFFGPKMMPYGVYGKWPPQFPEDLVAKGGALPIYLDADPRDDLRPGFIGLGSAAASSSSAAASSSNG